MKESNQQEEIRKLVDYFKGLETDVPRSHIDRKWEELLGLEKKRRQRKYWKCPSFYYKVAGLAAVLCGAVWLAVGPWGNPRSLDAAISRLEEMSVDTLETVTLVVGKADKIELKQEDKISYGQKGQVFVNRKSVSGASSRKENGVVNYNQLLVPKGQSSHLRLSDGSELYVNSGTKVIYPDHFTGDQREIYIDGEICIDVAKDHGKAFVVRTPDIRVKVLGTLFNVNSYKGSGKSEVVLVRGSVAVSAGLDEKEYLLSPNELLDVSESGIRKLTVDACKYIEWIRARMSLDGNSVGEAIRKLGVYYGVTVTCDPEVGSLLLGGSCDLSVPLETVLRRISHIVPVVCETTPEGGYHLRMKK